jgi:hypothetical protein
MRLMKVLGLMVCVFAFYAVSMAGENKMSVRDVNQITFVAPVRVGTSVLPAGDYTVRHVMEGQDHVMVFQLVHGKDLVKVKCTLVALPKKADKDEEVYTLASGNERVLQELTFRGDTAKHVF